MILKQVGFVYIVSQKLGEFPVDRCNANNNLILNMGIKKKHCILHRSVYSTVKKLNNDEQII